MWIWDQSAGTLSRDGELVSRGYSGKSRGKNNPALQGLRGVGPIPTGRWLMTGVVMKHPKLGPYVIRLDKIDSKPGDDTDEVTGRGAFRIHGDNATGTASEGCIILPRAVREQMWRSGDRGIEVVE